MMVGSPLTVRWRGRGATIDDSRRACRDGLRDCRSGNTWWKKIACGCGIWSRCCIVGFAIIGKYIHSGRQLVLITACVIHTGCNLGVDCLLKIWAGIGKSCGNMLQFVEGPSGTPNRNSSRHLHSNMIADTGVHLQMLVRL